MPETLSELFNAGLVTVRHPALLAKGELQRADDCVYREKDPAIWRAPGRRKLNATALGSVWSTTTAVKGMGHLSFERSRLDQLLVYNGTVFARAALSASSAPTIDVIDGVISCNTTNASATITSVALFGSVQVGWNVMGTGIANGTQVKTVTNSSSIILTLAATATGSVDLTFNPMLEMGGAASIAGTISGTTTFTATTGYPFLVDVIGARLYIAGTPGIRISAVSGQNGTTGHYNIVTLDTAQSNGAATLVFAQGCVQTLSNATGDMFDFAQYGNSYFVWTGAGNVPQRISWRPRSVTSGLEYRELLSMRPMGLKPVVDAPVVTLVTDGTYTWPTTLLLGNYWFLVTEIFDPAGTPSGGVGLDEIESNYEGGAEAGNSKLKGVPISVNVTAFTTKGVQIVLPRQVNIGVDGRISNYWGIYMYGPSDAVPSLAAFRRVRKVAMTSGAPVGTQTIILHETQTVETQYANGTAAVSGYSQFSNPSNMAGGAAGYVDGALASASSGSGTAGANDLTFPSFVATGTVIGIRVQLRMISGRGTYSGYSVQLVSGSKISAEVLATVGSSFLGTTTHGSSSDNWAVAWSAAGDFTTGTFKVRLRKSFSAATQQIDVDGVQVTITYSSTALNLNGLPYRIVTFRDQIGSVVNVPARGIIPTCNTGDLFQGSIAVNDLSDETAVRYSLPGEPESFPSAYVLRFNTTKRRDRVTFIRTLGLVLVIGLENGVQRVNYLPTETDTDFKEGLAHDDISTDHGIPGPLAGVKFDWPGRGTVIAYATGSGVFYTDGLKSMPLNMDLDWPNTVKISALSTCVFRVYPKEKWLVLYYCPVGATHNENTRALVFHYASDKIKDGDTLPALGPIKVSGCSSAEVVLSGATYLFTGHQTDGFVYQEDYGVAQPVGYQVHNAAGSYDATVTEPITPIVRTRRMYPAGITHDCHLFKAYLLQSLYGSTYTAVANSTINSTTLSATTPVFALWLPGMRVKGAGIDEGTIVLTVAVNLLSVTLSRAANATGTGVTFTADSGTIGVSDRGNSIGEASASMHTVYGSSLASDMVVMALDDTRQGLELQIEKVPLTFTTDVDGYRYETATWADLGTNMRLHQLMLLFEDAGPEQTRSTA